MDDDGNAHEGLIEAIVEVGVTQGCDAELYCPHDSVTRAQMASFLVRAFALPEATLDYFSDDDSDSHETNINALAAAGVTLGCGSGEYCPEDKVRRDQMATFIARALGLVESESDAFGDDDGNPHEENINAVADEGITTGCGADSYCPAEVVPRDQMASLVARSLGLEPIDVPPRPTTTTTSSTTTTQPVDDGQGWGCHSAYIDCVPNHPVDVDCAGGSGNGPVYVEGPIRLVSASNDPYDLDHNSDGIGCET